MARIVARNASLGIDNSSAACTSISGRTNSVTVSFSGEAPDVTAFDNTGYRERVPDGLKDWELSISGLWDGSGTDLDATLFPILAASTRVAYGPAGSTSGCTKYEASAICTDYNVEAAVEGAVTFSATFTGRSGSMTRTTWT